MVSDMHQVLCILMAMIGYGMSGAHCQAPRPSTTTITFQSSTYSDMRQLSTREAATGAVTVKAYLRLPEQLRDRYPTVIIVHTIAGYRDANEGYVAAELRKAGFATLTYDSFAARGTTGAALSGSSGYLPMGVADAYVALRLLSGMPQIDADRIAIVGFSYGGEVAHLKQPLPIVTPERSSDTCGRTSGRRHSAGRLGPCRPLDVDHKIARDRYRIAFGR